MIDNNNDNSNSSNNNIQSPVITAHFSPRQIGLLRLMNAHQQATIRHLQYELMSSLSIRSDSSSNNVSYTESSPSYFDRHVDDNDTSVCHTCRIPCVPDHHHQVEPKSSILSFSDFATELILPAPILVGPLLVRTKLRANRTKSVDWLPKYVSLFNGVEHEGPTLFIYENDEVF